MIQDSGNRREFETGAVRDIAEGKGRCDLLPLDIVSNFIGKDTLSGDVLKNIYQYTRTGDSSYAEEAVKAFLGVVGWDISTGILEVSKHFEEGCNKYGERNWEKGIYTHCYIDSAVRHYLKFIRGDNDERHDRAFLWNILCCMWTAIHIPQMNDLPCKLEK